MQKKTAVLPNPPPNKGRELGIYLTQHRRPIAFAATPELTERTLLNQLIGEHLKQLA
jgi:hypothetical protein